jgi:hypothetical protein
MIEKKTSKALLDVSASLGIDPNDLIKLIDFETRGTWNPQIKNPLSSARGLLQFTDSTARNLGYKDSLDLVTKNGSIESQLYFPVLKYLSQFKPFPTKQSLYMSVFYPAAREWPLNKNFPDTVKQSNPGIKTVADYVNKVEKKKPGGAAGLLSLIALAAILLLMKGK